MDKIIKRKEAAFIQPIIKWENSQKQLENSLFTNSGRILNNKSVLSFERFVNFIIYEIESNSISHGTLHWWPFTNLCRLCHIRYDFIGDVETWTSDIKYLSNLTEFSKFNLSSINKEKFNHSARKTKKDASIVYFRQLTEETVKKLYNIYKSDFYIGGYKYQNYIDASKNNRKLL